jgi:hypothetical protein
LPPERQQAEECEPSPTPAATQDTDAESDDLALWLSAIPSVATLRGCKDALAAIPTGWSAESKQKAANAVEMREASIRGGRGERAN